MEVERCGGVGPWMPRWSFFRSSFVPVSFPILPDTAALIFMSEKQGAPQEDVCGCFCVLECSGAKPR